MIRHRIFQAEAAEPPIGQVQMHFLAQPPLGSNAEAVTDKSASAPSARHRSKADLVFRISRFRLLLDSLLSIRFLHLFLRRRLRIHSCSQK
jgi:hypothetical protein